MKQNNSLFLTLYHNIITEFHNLNLNQISVFLWTMNKTRQSDKNVVLAIYKKLYQILENNQKIILTQNVQSNTINTQKHLKQQEQQKYNQTNQQSNFIQLFETNFTLLIWSLQRTKIIDNKLLINLLKHVINNQGHKNIKKIRIQNICLLLYSLTQLNFQKYRITQTIINQIMENWQQLQNISILTLVILLDSFRKCIIEKQKLIIKYSKQINEQKKPHKLQNAQKQRKFFLLILQTILLRHQTENNPENRFRKKRYKNNEQQFKKLTTLLSPKFSSQIMFNLGVLNIYDKQIYFKVLSCLTDNIDQAQTQDLSMALCGICNLKITGITTQQKNQRIFQHKQIICKRIFQIYTSIQPKSLNIIKDLIHNKKIQNQLIPTRIRKDIQQQYSIKKIQKENQNNTQFNTKNVQK